MILNRGERNALRRFSREQLRFESPSKWKGIGLPSLRSLAAKGLVVEGPPGIYGPTFRLTEAGLEYLDRLDRRARRPVPSHVRDRGHWPTNDETVLA